MKKAKIMLSVIAIFAVVGATYAIKAKRQQLFYFTKTVNSCVLAGKLDLVPGAPTIGNIYTTTTNLITSFPSTYCTVTTSAIVEQ